VHLAAGSAPVAVKCRTVKAVNKVKILPVASDYQDLCVRFEASTANKCTKIILEN
jgi:hypothetical protein